MSWLGAVCALVVGAALLISGIAKLGQTRATRKAMDDLAVPRALRRPVLAQALPLVELVLAAGVFLAPGVWHRVAGALAGALLVTFTALLARVVRSGRTVDCACFGALGNGAVTWRSVVRNAVLTLGAVAFAATPDAFLSTAADLAPGLGWLLAAIALATAVALRLRHDRRRRQAVDALELTDVDGRVLAFRELTDPPTYLVFLSARCSACASLVPRLRTWPTMYGEVIDIQPVLLGAPEDFADREVFGPLVDYVLYDRDKLVTKALDITAFPAGVLLTKDQPLGSAPAPGYGPMHMELETFAKERGVAVG